MHGTLALSMLIYLCSFFILTEIYLCGLVLEVTVLILITYSSREKWYYDMFKTLF
jgi:hypothetical protein